MKRTKRILVFPLLCLLILCLGVSAYAAEASLPAWSLSEPVVVKDESLSTGQKTRWSCITFGSYPQTEIVSAPFSAVDTFAVQDGDILEDPALYEKLGRADWQENETEIDGVRYLRMSREDAVTSAPDRAGNYRWGEEEWHYFRFDPIRWRVLRLEDGKAFLMADKLLDCQPYHTEAGPVSWERSTVRSWLNGYPGTENDAGVDYLGKGFLDRAFSAVEREAVVITHVENKPNPRYGTDCGNDTEDRVFLLSNAEVFASDAAGIHGFWPSNGFDDPAKRFRSTMYAKCRGTWWSSVNRYLGNSFWFMRTNGYTPESITYICDFGFIYQRGTIATCEDAGLLPALWISLDQAKYAPAGTVSSADIQNNSFRPAPEDSPKKEQVFNPSVVYDEKQPDGKQVTFSLIRFGSYPQAEVVPDPSEASSTGSIVDAALYAALEKAEWENGEWETGGTRYLRVSSPGADGSEDVRYFACEPLLWRVLEVRDGIALLLSQAAVDCEPFQKDLADVSWDSCTLRSWLNGYGPQQNASAADYSGDGDSFLNMAFSAEEQEAILAYPVQNENNHYFGTDSGPDTVDKIFLLAESELFMHDSSVIHGFSPRDDVPDRARQFKPTDYAVWKGAWDASGSVEYGNVFWITRTTGYTHSNVVYVDESGYIYNRGILVTCPDAAVIPALILELNSDVYDLAGTCTITEE